MNVVVENAIMVVVELLPCCCGRDRGRDRGSDRDCALVVCIVWNVDDYNDY